MTERTTPTTDRAFARVSGSPGETPLLTGLFRALWPLFFIFAAAGYLVRAAWPLPEMTWTQTGFLFLILSALFAWIFFYSERRLNQYVKGARGEEMVARVLGFLPKGYHVFHGLSDGAGRVLKLARDLDHVVVGPAGIFVIETKNWSGDISISNGRILYNGKEPDRPPLEQVREAAGNLQQALEHHCGVDLPVQPVVCFASMSLKEGSVGLSGVVVCDTQVLRHVILDSVETPLPRDVRLAAVTFLEKWVQ